jgi:hypothetical protein
MEAIYTRYRKLKKEIRDLAATDLQRTLRGFMSRKIHGGLLRSATAPAVMLHAAGASATGSGAGNAVSPEKAVRDKATSSVKRADFASNFFVPPNSAAGNAAAVAGGNSAEALFPGSSIPVGLYGAYRDLLEKKRDLKRRLKKFDEDFFENWGRNPKKSDKEVIRPMYQSYHEVCTYPCACS